jgi:coproporphyrinogen III oxidase
MKISREIEKKLTSQWFAFLQEKIVEEFQNLESEFSIKNRTKVVYFKKKLWKKKDPKDGGGQYYILRNGQIFDKVGVNHSTVEGVFQKNYKSNIPGTKKNQTYWASGVSVVAHMRNPKIPAVHFNTRFVVTSKKWFGGGMDVTPSLKDSNEKKLVHKNLKLLCNNNKKSYKNYKKWCDDYFLIKHREETRGIGGIFFDYLYKDWEKNFKFVRDVGIGFIEITKMLIEKKRFLKWTKKQKHNQLIKRGKYVEFNLLYDRGTKFGLNTGGNIDAIFMSLPPDAKWK